MVENNLRTFAATMNHFLSLPLSPTIGTTTIGFLLLGLFVVKCQVSPVSTQTVKNNHNLGAE